MSDCEATSAQRASLSGMAAFDAFWTAATLFDLGILGAEA